MRKARWSQGYAQMWQMVVSSLDCVAGMGDAGMGRFIGEAWGIVALCHQAGDKSKRSYKERAFPH